MLLVLFSWPESRERLDRLRSAAGEIAKNNTAILAVPMTDLSPDELAAAVRDLPFSVVTQGAREISSSYALFRRTLSLPDLFGRARDRNTLSFFDRFGYLRARWIPQEMGLAGEILLSWCNKLHNSIRNEKFSHLLATTFIDRCVPAFSISGQS